jgi:hypothetical protein
MRRIINLLRPGRYARALIPAVVVAFLGSVTVSWADDAPGPGVTAWGWESLGATSAPDVYTGLSNWGLEEDYSFAGALFQPDGTYDVAAGIYHLSGDVVVSNPSRFDRNVSCNVYAMADGDTDKTVVDSTSGPLPGLTENEYYYGDNVVHTFRGAFSSVFKLSAPGRVWLECTGGDDGQEPWDGMEEKHRPDYSSLDSRLIATRMSGQLPDWLTGA